MIKCYQVSFFFFVSRIRCKKIQNQPNILLTASSLFHPTTNNLVFLFCSPLGFPGSLAGKESTCHAGDPGSIAGLGRSPGEWRGYPLPYSWASLVAQTVKDLPAMQETWVRSLGEEDPLEEGHSNPLQYSCLENPHGQRSLVGYGTGVAKSQTQLNY